MPGVTVPSRRIASGLSVFAYLQIGIVAMSAHGLAKCCSYAKAIINTDYGIMCMSGQYDCPEPCHQEQSGSSMLFVLNILCKHASSLMGMHSRLYRLLDQAISASTIQEFSPG